MSMPPNIEVKNVFKIFGSRAKEALAMIQQEKTKDQVLSQTGCVVGIEALASPIFEATIIPPLMIISGLEPKKAGFQSTRSANFPFSTEPTYSEIPWVMAGLIVYFAI